MCKARVDFPTPGLPPRSNNEPGNNPPPNTRSASIILVDSLSPGSDSKISFKGLYSRNSVLELFVLPRVLNSESVPHSLQLGHCPCHLGKSSPQAEHKKLTLFFLLAIKASEIGFHG